MEQEWVGKSLTVWGVVIAVLTALLPAVSALFPDIAATITPESIAGLSEAVKTTITSIGVVVGGVMIIVDRISGNTAKALTFSRK